MSTRRTRYDVVILGAGHNGLVAASYLTRAGLSVLLLEKNDYIGGATTSQQVFPDYDARLSRYSYLVSLFPEKIICDLGLNLELRRRTTGSFTPYARDGRHHGLLLSNVSEETSAQSVFELTGNRTEHEQMKKFYHLSRVFAGHTWDSMLEPLVAKDEFKRRFEDDPAAAGREAWRSLVEEPIGRAIERYLQRRSRARPRPDRCEDWCLHPSARSIARPESLFPLPPHRQQDRGMEGAGRRDGCGRARARGNRAREGGAEIHDEAWKRNDRARSRQQKKRPSHFNTMESPRASKRAFSWQTSGATCSRNIPAGRGSRKRKTRGACSRSTCCSIDCPN